MAFDPSCVDVEDFLDALDIDNVSITGDQAYYSCPFPAHVNGDATPSATMNTDTTAFFCYACKERGNAISFASVVLGISPLEAIRLLKQRYDPGAYDPETVSMVDAVERVLRASEESERPQPQLDDDVLAAFSFDWADAFCEWSQTKDAYLGYLFARGFEPETLMDWQFGYDKLSDRLTLPVRDEHGQLVGFKARAYDGRQPKYLVLGDKPGKPPRYGFPCYFPSRIVFGADRVERNSALVVCEGELNAIAVSERTGRPAVAINGSHFSDRHARILRDLASSVILFLDDDAAGRNAVWGWVDSHEKHHPGIVDHLKDYMPVYLAARCDKDAAELSGKEIEGVVGGAESVLVRSLGI